MEIIREQFVERFIVLFHKELLNRLPEKAIATVMIHKSGVIINDLGSELIAEIHKSIKKEG